MRSGKCRVSGLGLRAWRLESTAGSFFMKILVLWGLS